MDGYTWYVFSVKDTEGKLYAFAERLPNSTNLTSIFYGIEDISVTMNACDSKKAAEAIAADWNESYRKQGIANKWIA